MLLNLDQLEKQLDKEEFQEIGSMDAFRVLMTQFLTFIQEQYYFVGFDDLMISKYFLAYTRTETQESKVVSSKAVDVDLVVMESNGMESEKRDTSSSSGTYITHVVDADIRLVNDQVPSAEVHLTAQHNVLANKQQHTEHLTSFLDTYLVGKCRSHTTQDSTILSQDGTVTNADLNGYQISGKGFANATLKNKLRKLNGTSVDTKFAKPSILGKPVLQPHKYQSVVRQPNAFKYERPNFSKPRFTSQVDVNNVLSKPVTPHYLPKVREYVLAKPHYVIAPGSSRNSQKESYGSNDMAHNHYLKEARKKTQEINRNSKPSVMPSVRLQNTANGHKFSPKKNFVVYEKTSPRSGLRWKPTGKIFTTVGLKWIPTGKLFNSCTSKVDSEPPNGSNDYITNPYECDQTLNVSAGTLNLSAANNTSGPAPQRKERCTLQCALSLKEEKSSYLRPVSSTFFIFSHARSIIKSGSCCCSRAVDPADSPSSTIDQDVPSASTSSTNQEIQSQVTHKGVGELIHRHQNAEFNKASLLHNLSSDSSSEETTF
ncbi:hypothetical protein Tco_0034033 [Tanacetum coccineum]